MTDVVEIHVFLCPRCSDLTVVPTTESDAGEGEHEIQTGGGIMLTEQSDEAGVSRGVYLTPGGVVECLNRHAERMEQEADDATAANAAKHKKNKADAEFLRNAFFGDAAMPADWQDKTGDELLAAVGDDDG